MTDEHKLKVRTRYPLSSILIYNGTTIAHYLLGAFGIASGYRYGVPAYIAAGVYLFFSVVQMYILMPLKVCPNCVYYRMPEGRCVSGMNLFSRKIAVIGIREDFPNRAKGVFCHNHLYMAALVLPLLLMLPPLVAAFSFPLLVVFLLVAALLVFRIFILFPQIACVHCCAKNECPNAISMGLNEGAQPPFVS